MQLQEAQAIGRQADRDEQFAAQRAGWEADRERLAVERERERLRREQLLLRDDDDSAAIWRAEKRRADQSRAWQESRQPSWPQQAWDAVSQPLDDMMRDRHRRDEQLHASLGITSDPRLDASQQRLRQSEQNLYQSVQRSEYDATQRHAASALRDTATVAYPRSRSDQVSYLERTFGCSAPLATCALNHVESVGRVRLPSRRCGRIALIRTQLGSP